MRISDNQLVGGNIFVGDLRGLKDLVLPDSLEVVENGWFANSGIESAAIPASVRELGDCAFACCKLLKRVDFQPGSVLKRIGARCFFMSGLEGIKTPQGLAEIGERAFSRCAFLRNVVLNEGLRVLGEAVFAHTPIERVDVPSTVQILPKSTFCQCKSLREVQFHEGPDELGEGCFWETKFPELNIPASVRVIEKHAFGYCRELKQLEFTEGSRLERVGDYALFETQLKGKVHFPEGAEIPDTLFDIKHGEFCAV